MPPSTSREQRLIEAAHDKDPFARVRATENLKNWVAEAQKNQEEAGRGGDNKALLQGQISTNSATTEQAKDVLKSSPAASSKRAKTVEDNRERLNDLYQKQVNVNAKGTLAFTGANTFNSTTTNSTTTVNAGTLVAGNGKDSNGTLTLFGNIPQANAPVPQGYGGRGKVPRVSSRSWPSTSRSWRGQRRALAAQSGQRQGHSTPWRDDKAAVDQRSVAQKDLVNTTDALLSKVNDRKKLEKLQSELAARTTSSGRSTVDDRAPPPRPDWQASISNCPRTIISMKCTASRRRAARPSLTARTVSNSTVARLGLCRHRGGGLLIWAAFWLVRPAAWPGSAVPRGPRCSPCRTAGGLQRPAAHCRAGRPARRHRLAGYALRQASDGSGVGRRRGPGGLPQPVRRIFGPVRENYACPRPWIAVSVSNTIARWSIQPLGRGGLDHAELGRAVSTGSFLASLTPHSPSIAVRRPRPHRLNQGGPCRSLR